MRLVFIHGWGFDASFWDMLSSALPDIPQTRVDLGFFSDHTNIPTINEGDILVGHSLGFLWGLLHSTKWRGWVSISGFVRFTDNTEQKACVPPSALRALRQSLAKNPEQTVQNFYKNIGASDTIQPMNFATSDNADDPSPPVFGGRGVFPDSRQTQNVGRGEVGGTNSILVPPTSPQSTVGIAEILCPPSPPEDGRRGSHQHRPCNAAHLAAGLEILQNGDASAALQNSSARGLVLASTNDPLVPAAASEFLAGQNKNAKILWQEGGHLLPVTHTPWCADAIRDFVA